MNCDPVAVQLLCHLKQNVPSNETHCSNTIILLTNAATVLALHADGHKVVNFTNNLTMYNLNYLSVFAWSQLVQISKVALYYMYKEVPKFILIFILHFCY